MIDDDMPSYEEMAKALTKNPLRAIQLARKASGLVNQLKYDVAAIAFGYATIIRSDPDHRDYFYEEEHWKDRRKAPQAAKLLLHVFMYVYGAHGGRAYKRASEHSIALQSIFDKGEMHHTEIAQYLAENGGFDGLLDDADDDSGEGSPMPPPAAEGDAGSQPPKPRAAQRSTEGAGTIASDDGSASQDNGSSDDQADDSDDPPFPPARKPKPEVPQNELDLLPRDYIASCILSEPKNDDDRYEILQAFKAGRPVNIRVLPKTYPSSFFELYEGGGGFISGKIDTYSIE